MRSHLPLLRRLTTAMAAGLTLSACFTYRTAPLRALAPGDHIRLESARGLHFGPATADQSGPACGATRVDGIYAAHTGRTIALQPLDGVRGADSTFCETWRGSSVTVVADTATLATKRRHFSLKRTAGLTVTGLLVLLVYSAANAAAAGSFLAGPS